MSRTFLVSFAAKIDVDEISLWYEQQGSQLGKKFLRELSQKFRSIIDHPEIYRCEKNSEIRRCKLDRWPYFIFFAATETAIEVVAIIHTSRDPKYIATRTSLS